jgi:site-specific recombinase XerD
MVDDIKWEEHMMLVTGKTGTRLVPLTMDMLRLLKHWLKRRQQFTTAKTSPYLFISVRTEKLCPIFVASSFRRHRIKYKLPRITPHTFRHVFCTNYLKQGGDIEKLRNITGHTSYQTLQGYLHMAKLGGKAAHEELEKVNILKDM